MHNFLTTWRSDLERRFYDDHVRTGQSFNSQPSLSVASKDKCFTMIISAWWNLVSSKLKKSEENSTGKT